jgi:hypothetical protein
MTSADSFSLILRRLDEIERKLDRMMEELRPTAIGYSVRRAIVQGRTDGPKKQIFGVNEQIPRRGQSDCPKNAQRYSIKVMLAVLWLRWSVERGNNREIEAD